GELSSLDESCSSCFGVDDSSLFLSISFPPFSSSLLSSECRFPVSEDCISDDSPSSSSPSSSSPSSCSSSTSLGLDLNVQQVQQQANASDTKHISTPARNRMRSTLDVHLYS